MDAARQLAQLAQRGLELSLGLGEQFAVAAIVGQQLQREPGGQQSLLRAVVQVALQALAFGIAGGDDPRPRFAQLGQLRAQLRLKLRVLKGQRRRGPGRLEQRSLLDQPGVVNDRRHRLVLRTDQRHRAARCVSPHDQRRAVAVDEALLLR